MKGKSTSRLIDILIFGWIGGKHACADPGISPVVSLRSEGFITSQASLKVVSCKVAKHKKICIDNQYVFIPFDFDKFGFLAAK